MLKVVYRQYPAATWVAVVEIDVFDADLLNRFQQSNPSQLYDIDFNPVTQLEATVPAVCSFSVRLSK